VVVATLVAYMKTLVGIEQNFLEETFKELCPDATCQLGADGDTEPFTFIAELVTKYFRTD